MQPTGNCQRVMDSTDDTSTPLDPYLPADKPVTMEMLRAAIESYYGEREPQRFLNEVQVVCGLTREQRSEYLRNVEAKRGAENAQKLYDGVQEELKRRRLEALK